MLEYYGAPPHHVLQRCLGTLYSLREVSSLRVPSPLALYQDAGWRDGMQKVPPSSSSFDEFSINVTSTDLQRKTRRKRTCVR